MKVKTFMGGDAAKLDGQVNAFLADIGKASIHEMHTAATHVRGPQTGAERPIVVITVWYD